MPVEDPIGAAWAAFQAAASEVLSERATTHRAAAGVDELNELLWEVRRRARELMAGGSPEF